jgi:hypothetical protein
MTQYDRFALVRVSMLRSARKDDYPGKLIQVIFVHVRCLISRDVLSVMIRTLMMRAIQEDYMLCPKGAPHFARHGGSAV